MLTLLALHAAAAIHVRRRPVPSNSTRPRKICAAQIFAATPRTTAVARLHEYVRSELAAAPNVHTAVLVLE